MKKFLLLTLSLCLGMLLFAGCASDSANDNNDDYRYSNEYEESLNLEDPILEWYQLYNHNGFNTFTGVLSNPNDCDIDTTYDIVFYKDGNEVSRIEYCLANNVSPKHNELLWANSNIPKASDVDEVRLENFATDFAFNDSIDATYELVSNDEVIGEYKFKFDKKPVVASVSFLLYKDLNKNKKCDSGEVVITSISSSFEKEDTFSYDAESYDYDSVEVYYNAY